MEKMDFSILLEPDTNSNTSIEVTTQVLQGSDLRLRRGALTRKTLLARNQSRRR